MDKTDPYPALLGIDWAFSNYAIIDLKHEEMTFGVDGIKVIQPPDPDQGPQYTELCTNTMEKDILDQIYSITTGKRDYYVNPTADGSISWRSIHSFYSYLEEAFNEWKNR